MTLLEALIAGIIQGLTEFLPISSSGHLVIYGELTGEAGDGGNLAFTVFLHFATLLAVILVYRKDVWALIRELVGTLADLSGGKPDMGTPGRRYLLMVIIGTIPAVIAGAGVKVLDLDSMLENIYVVAVMLIVTAVFMFLVDRLKEGEQTAKDAPLKTAWLVGILQGIAILPGLSRSGSTIFGGVLGGLKKEFAVRFAFILSIPAILGAAAVELYGVVKGGEAVTGTGNLIVGFVAAFVCGILAIKVIKVLINSKKFFIFGIYCCCASVFAFLVAFGVIGA
jgi:undecaprenyl-diphosphatase